MISAKELRVVTIDSVAVKKCAAMLASQALILAQGGMTSMTIRQEGPLKNRPFLERVLEEFRKAGYHLSSEGEDIVLTWADKEGGHES